jgi:thiaminase
MLNSEIKHNNPDYYSKFDNDFENKFSEFREELAKELGIDARYILERHLSEVYDRYSKWLFDTQHKSFCSIVCAIEWLTKQEETK